MNNLRNAREFCFQFFFHLQLPVFDSLKGELQEEETHKLLSTHISDFKESTNTLLDDKMNKFVIKQLSSCLKNYKDVEKVISGNLKNWKISRLSKVDHTILILAVNELCFTKAAPPKVIINEAIELSKKFGSQESPSFINGILDSIAKKDPSNLR